MSKTEIIVSVVVPLYNSANYIITFLEELESVLKDNYTDYEIVLVDNGSKDKNVELVRQFVHSHNAIRLIILSRKFDLYVAIISGIENVIGDYNIVINPKTDAADLIPKLIDRALEGNDVVYGVSAAKQRRNGLPSLCSKLFYFYLKKYMNIYLEDNTTNLRCMSRYAVNSFMALPNSHCYYRLFQHIVGLSSSSFPYEFKIRDSSLEAQKFSSAANEAIQIIIDNSSHPLRFCSFIGLSLAGINLIYMFYITVVYLLKDDVAEGWTTLSVQVSVLFMCVILMLTIVSEYIGRMMDRIKKQPKYFIKEEIDSPIKCSNERINVVTNSQNKD